MFKIDYKNALTKKDRWQTNLPAISFIVMSVLYFIVSCYKLTFAPLWFDETVEFYFSRHLFSSYVPGEGTANMYQRIISTFQPPLYNFLMFFWLKISESEWWFRFAGVVVGYIGVVGIYFTAKHLTNCKWATLTAAMYFCLYQIHYYIQECAEYNLLIAFLPWTVYFFFKALEKSSWKNIILFTLFCILPIYSQYGAVFAVVPMISIVFINSVLSKDWSGVKKISISYICALIFAALPLYFLFLKPQILNEHRIRNVTFTNIADDISFYQNNILVDFIKNMFDCFNWNMFGGKLQSTSPIVPLSTIIVFLSVTSCLYCLFKSKNKRLKLFICSVSVSMIIFYIAVKTKIYAHPIYARNEWYPFITRYTLFFIPFWLILMVTVFLETINSFSTADCKRLLSKLLLVFSIFFCCLDIANIYVSHYVNNYTGKGIEDARTLVNKWFDLELYSNETIFSLANDTLFSYYFTRHKQYNPEMESNIMSIKEWGGDLEKHVIMKCTEEKVDSFSLIDIRSATIDKIKKIAVDNGYTVTLGYDSGVAGGGKIYVFNKVDK